VSETKSLWGTEDQSARLSELTSNECVLKEARLRRDVRFFGRVLGEVLKERAGQELFDAVEEIRLLAIEYRESAAASQQDPEAARANSHSKTKTFNPARFATFFKGCANPASTHRMHFAFWKRLKSSQCLRLTRRKSLAAQSSSSAGASAKVSSD